jgi:type I restriction-modification system DNA methylase subunit
MQITLFWEIVLLKMGIVVKPLDTCLPIPPLAWNGKKHRKFIREEHEKEGYNGRFGAGLPRISDGSLLFLQHLISKMRQDEKGSRIAIIFNGSPYLPGMQVQENQK